MTKYDVNQTDAYSDTMANYGVGARIAFGQDGRFVAGLG